MICLFDISKLCSRLPVLSVGTCCWVHKLNGVVDCGMAVDIWNSCNSIDLSGAIWLLIMSEHIWRTRADVTAVSTMPNTQTS